MGGDRSTLKELELVCHSKVRAKRRTHRLLQLQQHLAVLRSNPRALWQRLRSSHYELPLQLQNVQAWSSCLSTIANVHVRRIALPPLSYPVHLTASPSLLEALHAPISLGEVQRGLQHLHNGRACGRDGLPAELLRYAKGDSSPHVLAPILMDVFNAAFVVGKVPICLQYALVTPVYKKGDKLNTGNYRPIAVTDSIMRLYASILNARLVSFTGDANLRVETQAGFRPGLSTTHQLFTLQHFIDSNKPLYTCFLDLKGAYDQVDRDLLWEAMRRLNITGSFLGALQSLYCDCRVAIKVCGRISNGLPSKPKP